MRKPSNISAKKDKVKNPFYLPIDLTYNFDKICLRIGSQYYQANDITLHFGILRILTMIPGHLAPLSISTPSCNLDRANQN